MIKTEPRERELSEAMLTIFPRIKPSEEFVNNLLLAYDKDNAGRSVARTTFTNWVMIKAGLIIEDFGGQDTFRVIDNKLYTFALLRYS